MRKFWALALFLAVIVPVRAQLPAGATAPDFTATDLNGQNWRLYDLLDQGKIVILEISATWCSPCWAYHNGHAMHDFYVEHGPAGDDKARVLFVEGDPKTNVNCLYGQAGCNDYSPGNWVAGTPFPIINNDSIASQYKIKYFPTILVICPSRKAYEIGQWNAHDIWEKAAECPVPAGVNNAGIFDYYPGTSLGEICGTQEIKPSLSLVNLGTEALKQATISMTWNDDVVQVKEWTGNLQKFESYNIIFDAFPVQGAGSLKTQLTYVNYKPGDDDPSNNLRTDTFTAAQAFNDIKILLKIRTDQFGAETYWELRNAQNQVLESGGNQAVGPDGGGKFPGGIVGGPGAYSNNSIIRDTLLLPEPGCYSIHFVDAFGDGMCCDYGNGYYKLYNLDDPVYPILSGGDFKAYAEHGFSAGIDITPTMAPGTADIPELRLYPNPATMFIRAAFSLPQPSAVSVSVVNAMGQRILFYPEENLPGGEHQRELALDFLPAGFYWLQLSIDRQTIARKFLIQRVH